MLNKKDEAAINTIINFMTFLGTVIDAHLKFLKEGSVPCPFIPDDDKLNDIVNKLTREVKMISEKGNVKIVIQCVMKFSELVDVHNKIRKAKFDQLKDL